MQLRKTQTKINNQQQHNQAATEVTLLGVLLDIKLSFELHVKKKYRQKGLLEIYYYQKASKMFA